MAFKFATHFVNLNLFTALFTFILIVGLLLIKCYTTYHSIGSIDTEKNQKILMFSSHKKSQKKKMKKIQNM